MALRLLPRPFRRSASMAVTSGRGRREFASWPRSRAMCEVRNVLVIGFLLPIIRLLYRVEVTGREKFDRAAGPRLVISNHIMHLDWAILFAAMPAAMRRRLLVAAAATDICGNPIRRVGVEVVGNAFPFDKEGSGIRESLEFVTGMLDDGWNVLLFPEGKLTVAGPMGPFKPGIGWLVAHSSAEVVPVRIDILRKGGYEGKWWPHPRGHVLVSVGDPVRLKKGDSYAAVVERLEQSVRDA